MPTPMLRKGFFLPTVLSLWHSHCWSSPDSSSECRTAIKWLWTLRHLGHESTSRLLSPAPTIVVVHHSANF